MASKTEYLTDERVRSAASGSAARRLEALRASRLLDAGPDEAFDRLTRLAQRSLAAPVSLVSLVDEDRQFFLSQQGLAEPWRTRRETPLSHSFCQHVVERRGPLAIEDARAHALVRGNLAIDELDVVAYLGAPISDAAGAILGTVCVIDHEPRPWTEADIATLSDLARAIEDSIALRHELRLHEATSRELRERESLLRLAVEAAQFGVWSTDFKTGTTYWDPRCRELMGVGAEEPASAERGFDVVHPEDRTRAQEAFEQAKASDDGRYRVENRLVMPDGEVRWASSWGRIYRDAEGAPARVIGISTDITERRAMLDLLHERGRELEALNTSLEDRVEQRTAALRARSEQVRSLTRALTLAEQAERRRIAYVLHDDLQQLLFGTQLHVQAAHQELGAESLAYVSDLLERALTLTRTLSHELAPPALDEDGLEIALAWLADQFSALHGLAVAFHAAAPCPVPDRSLRALIVQLTREMLFNVVKHADADHATLQLTCVDDVIEVVVEDDGRGFEPSTVDGQSGTGFGLRSARERVGLLGGDLAVDSLPDQGTRVSLRIPLAVDPLGSLPLLD